MAAIWAQLAWLARTVSRQPSKFSDRAATIATAPLPGRGGIKKPLAFAKKPNRSSGTMHWRINGMAGDRFAHRGGLCGVGWAAGSTRWAKVHSTFQ